MTERNSSPTDLRPQIEVVAKNDPNLFRLEGTVRGERTFLAVATQNVSISIPLLNNGANGHYPVWYRQYYGQELVISHSENFRLHDSPEPSQSANRGSEPEYAGQTENKEIALQILELFKMSKPPHHHNGPEYYHRINGALAVRTLNLASGERNEEILSAEKPLVVVPEGYIHQVKALEGVAISVLVCDFTKHDYHPNLSLFD